MRLTSFTNEDYKNLYAFMRPLWLDTYGAFLPITQIELLLDKYFSESGISHYREEGYEYYAVLDDANNKVGVLVYQLRAEGLYIDKLYLVPSARGKGYPKEIFALLQARDKALFLNVNQNNRRAVRCYEKNGFTIVKEERIELGGGMVNVDYVMKKFSQ
ncbi:MAG: GNAT family N-acetyltransferase [Clostridia bacterium]|nr:GNAT family N-acetyltransferase [Clostridia bacterium]